MAREDVRTADTSGTAVAALLAALRCYFTGCRILVQEGRSIAWASAVFQGVRHELVLFIEGSGAGALADAFVNRPETRDLPLSGHTLIELKPGNAARACRGGWARIAIEALTLDTGARAAPADPVIIPDLDLPPSGLVIARRGRDGQPFFLLGFADGAIVITNAQPCDGALKLHRFANEGQARTAAHVVRRSARLDTNGETWFVPTARETAPLTKEWIAALIVWATSLERELSQELRFLGPGAYPLTEQARARL